MNDAHSLQTLNQKLDTLLAAQARQAEFIDEMQPILRAAMDAGILQLDDLEKRGYFRYGRGMLGALDRVVGATTEEDLTHLADSVVAIMETARELTRPEVLSALGQAAEVLNERDRIRPLSPTKVFKVAREDDVQRGVAVMVEMLRHVGRAADAVGSGRRKRGLDRLQPSRARRPQPAQNRREQDRPGPVACVNPEPPLPAPAGDEPALAGLTLDSGGFLTDPGQWTEAVAEAFARQLGVSELTEAHWRAIRFARQEFLSTGVSPNIRRITKGSGVDTRTLYALFPKAPGKAIARSAGIPKPAGCI